MYKSKRLLLRPFNEGDAKMISEIKEDFIGLRAYAGRPFPNNEDGEKKWIANMYPSGLQSLIILVVEERATKEFVGYVAASNIHYINRNARVGIIFHRNARGKGYFKEASILFYSYLFNEINLHRLYSGVLIYNEIAIENDKKIGFKVEGIMKEHVYQNGKYYDEYIVGLSAEDFFKVNKVEDILDL